MLLFPRTGRGGNWQRLWRMEGKWFLALLTSLQVQMLELAVNLKNAIQLFCCWSKINKVCNFMQRSLNLLRAYIIYDLCQENWNAFACIMCNEPFLWLHIWCLPPCTNSPYDWELLNQWYKITYDNLVIAIRQGFFIIEND